MPRPEPAFVRWRCSPQQSWGQWGAQRAPPQTWPQWLLGPAGRRCPLRLGFRTRRRKRRSPACPTAAGCGEPGATRTPQRLAQAWLEREPPWQQGRGCTPGSPGRGCRRGRRTPRGPPPLLGRTACCLEPARGCTRTCSLLRGRSRRAGRTQPARGAPQQSPLPGAGPARGCLSCQTPSQRRPRRRPAPRPPPPLRLRARQGSPQSPRGFRPCLGRGCCADCHSRCCRCRCYFRCWVHQSCPTLCAAWHQRLRWSGCSVSQQSSLWG
mmetsp:Transcript_19637/g.75381  ORF Transcript_19637/g.75381 Transcript_19637/m.75381 type:complete len:267 (+) Transcript_19637:4147-4947(+)